jgi:UDP-GlcNAc:undecaprenyl-phosphate/decaprenyl-phosphate GlcNAc-1-phosphate transferase
MPEWPMLICGVTGLLISWSLIPVIQKFAARKSAGVQDRSFHHSHTERIPRLGGIAIAVAFVVVALVASAFASFEAPKRLSQWGLILGCLAMFGLGLRDDVCPLGAKIKLLVQLLIATAVYFSGVQIDQLKNPIDGSVYQLGAWGLVATVFWLVALTNLINLIDGIDGLAGGIALMLMCLLACFGLSADPFCLLLTIGAAGAIIGFLCFNFPPARIYMGDGGAYFLGFLIGALTIIGSHKGTVAAALIAPVFALALPIADVLLAILRRSLRGLPIFRPDRKHIHHRLVDVGFSRRGAVLVLYGLSLTFLFLAFVVFWSRGQLAPILFGAMFLIFFVSARLFGFVKDWNTVGKELGVSLSLRKETRYALAVCQWLEMEAERCETLQDLWTTYLFVTRKLNLSQVKLILDSGRTVSRDQSIHRQASDFHRNRHEMPLANIQAMEFASESSAMSPQQFDHLTELAAEGWMKAVKRWQVVNQVPAWFEPAMPTETTFFSRGRALIANVA